MRCVQRRACPRPLHLNLLPHLYASANQLPLGIGGVSWLRYLWLPKPYQVSPPSSFHTTCGTVTDELFAMLAGYNSSTMPTDWENVSQEAGVLD